MRRDSLALGLTALNLLLLGGIVLGRVDPIAARQTTSGVLRATGLDKGQGLQRLQGGAGKGEPVRVARKGL